MGRVARQETTTVPTFVMRIYGEKVVGFKLKNKCGEFVFSVRKDNSNYIDYLISERFLKRNSVSIHNRDYKGESWTFAGNEIELWDRLCDVKISRFGEIKNLPEPEEGTIYIVSQIVATAAKDRDDLFMVEDTIRDTEGRIIGAKNLAWAVAR